MKKRFIWLFLVLLFSCSVSVRADSFTTYDGNLSSTALSYFRDIDIPFFSNYVVFRDSDYSYKMFVSDSLETSGSGFVGGSGTIYNWYTSGNYYNTQHYSHYDINSFTLSNNDHFILYSNLGTYARLERGLEYDKAQLFIIFTACIFCLIGFIFKCINVMPFGNGSRNRD